MELEMEEDDILEMSLLRFAENFSIVNATTLGINEIKVRLDITSKRFPFLIAFVSSDSESGPAARAGGDDAGTSRTVPRENVSSLKRDS